MYKRQALFSAFERIFDKDYYFGGETHDFWELVCVVEGAIRVTAGEDIFMLEEVLFHSWGQDLAWAGAHWRRKSLQMLLRREAEWAGSLLFELIVKLLIKFCV